VNLPAKSNKQTPKKKLGPGPGRPKGSRNKRAVMVEEMARKYADGALRALAEISETGESEAARVSASVALLDRGFGKARQAVEHTGAEGGPIEVAVTHRVVDAD
jgi:hypothetical protein